MASISESKEEIPREEDIDNEMLISEIEKRAPLYNKEMKEYSDVDIKKRLWTEVCQAIFPLKWEKLAEEEKIIAGSVVQKRWRNIRACFSREIRTQKNSKSGQAAVKRRKYMYFDQLLFLLPSMEMRSTESNATEMQSENEDDVQTENVLERSLPPAKKRKTSYEESLLKILQEKKIQQPDMETNFALSLVPMLRSLPLEKKLDAQIQILQIFKTLNSSCNTSSKISTPIQSSKQ